jgi:hypothetical protein
MFISYQFYCSWYASVLWYEVDSNLETPIICEMNLIESILAKPCKKLKNNTAYNCYNTLVAYPSANEQALVNVALVAASSLLDKKLPANLHFL